jgi:farnesyl diphosphate synthase
MSGFELRLREAADQVTVALDALMPRGHGPEQRLTSAMRYAALAGGKRLRPFLTLEAGRLFDADETSVLRAACAVECVHTWSLVHGDLPCMDDDDFRRGQATVHRQYDEATALLAGDALLAFAFEVLGDPATHPDPQMRCLLLGALARTVGPQGIAAGKMLEVLRAELSGDIAAVTRMNRLRSGGLIGFALEVGALLGVAPDDGRHALARFATDISLAVQMIDDLMDVEASEDEVGKPVRRLRAQQRDEAGFFRRSAAAKDRAEVLARQAKTHLGIFGPRGRNLCDAVDFLLDRRY